MNDTLQRLMSIKRALRDYADTAIRLGMQEDDCLLWGFATLLALQSDNTGGFTRIRYDATQLLALTSNYLNQLNDAGFKIRILGRFEPPATHALVNLTYATEGRTLSIDDLNSILDWIVSQMSMEIQGSITPKEIATVMVSLLDVGQDKSILDPAMGSGSFLRCLQNQNSRTRHFVGVEKNEKVAFLTALYSHVNNFENTTLRLGGAFHYLQNQNQGFDYVISNPPVYRIPKNHAEGQFGHILLYRHVSSEMSLNFVQLGLQQLNKNGSAAFLLHMGILFSATETKLREEWVSRNLIKAVVSLPDKLLPHTSNKCAIVIFNNQSDRSDRIHLVKAGDLSRATADGRNVLADDALEQIKARLATSETTYHSAVVSSQDVAKLDYSLYPDHYVFKEIDDVAQKISREWTAIADLATVIQGTRNLTQIPKGDDNIIVGKSIRRMRDGYPFFEKKDLSHLEDKAAFTEPYDLLVQRIGENPAIHMILPEQSNIVVDQTVFILRFHQKSPALIHFIAEFLNSERGANHIASFCHNVTVQTLTKKILQKITVPIVDETTQSLVLEMTYAEKSLTREILSIKSLKVKLFDGLGYEKIENDFDGIRFSLNTLETALKNKDKISYKVSNQYPYPLAYAYRNLYLDREWSAVYENQMKFGELILSFLVSVGIALLNHHQEAHNINLTDLSNELSEALKSGISPGHWKSLLQNICLVLRDIPDCTLSNQLSSCLFKGRGNKLSNFGRDTLTEFIEKLNDKKHWRGPKGSQESKEAANLYKQNIDKALLEIEFLSDWEFFINDKLDYLPNSQIFYCSATLLRGDHPCFDQVDIHSKKPLPANDIYCRLSDEIVNLSPFLHFIYNPKTQRAEIFSLDKKNRNDEYQMKSFDSGQTIKTNSELTARLDAWFGKSQNNS